MSRLMMLPLLVVAAIAAGCGGSGGESESTSGSVAVAKQVEDRARPVAVRTAKGKRIKVVDSEFGRVVADGRGEALYLFDKEGGPKSKCYGNCAAVWPPVLTKGKPSAGSGAQAGLLGTTRRADGRLQVTYAGHPLYYYVGDSPGSILCHDVYEFGGTWLVVAPGGEAVG